MILRMLLLLTIGSIGTIVHAADNNQTRLCGDKPISITLTDFSANPECVCGNETLELDDAERYCCIPPGSSCNFQDQNSQSSQLIEKRVTCHNGTLLNRSEPCFHKCYNTDYLCGDVCTEKGDSCFCSDVTLSHLGYLDTQQYCRLSPRRGGSREGACINSGSSDGKVIKTTSY